MAYPMEKSAHRTQTDLSEYLPHRAILKDGTPVEVVRLTEQADIEKIHTLLNDAIEEGDTYPYENPLEINQFTAYYLSYDAFIMKTTTAPYKVVASVYIKPNYPGRSSHICNGGFLTMQEFRNQGAATIMAGLFKILAKKLGYKASLFNLVYASNPSSIRVWENLGFKRIATIPKAGRLKHFGYTDAYQYYCEF